jgi:hypothetical protein
LVRDSHEHKFVFHSSSKGKFGRTELSDIAGYVELPDGKVLSGSEWGNLLLWEGGFIKCEIARKGRKPCHVGAIECCYLDDGDIITAGADGHIKVRSSCW